MIPHILLVEDNNDIRFLATEFLVSNGFEVVTASNGQEAIEVLTKESSWCDLILLDFTMPVMTGGQFREKQLMIPEISKIPVILMSAEYNAPEIAENLRCDGWVRKSDFSIQLITEILKVLRLNNRIRVIPSRP